MRFSPVLLVPLVSLLAGPCELPQTDTPEPPVEPGRPAAGFVSVSVDDNVGCALGADGSLQCWGWNMPRPSPSERFSAVSVGGWVACGIREGGELHCWGAADSALLSPPEGRFSSVDVSRGAACGVRLDGGLVCWGGGAERWSLPEGGFTTVDVGPASACAVRADGAAVCWPWSAFPSDKRVREGPFVMVSVGGETQGSTTYSCGVLVGGAVDCWSEPSRWSVRDGDPAWWSPPAGVFVDVAVSSHFACGAREGGEVACWGLRESQPCGNGFNCRGWGEDPVPAGAFVAIGVGPGYAAGGETICGVRRDGQVRCWNDGTPRERPPVGEFAAIDVGQATCGLRLGGEAVCWGARVGWLDNIPAGAFTVVRGARWHGCGLRPGGAVECWGDNTWGAATPPPGQLTAIDVGGRLSCGLRAGGEAVCWGSNRYGEAEPPPGPFTAIEVHAPWWGTLGCGLRPDGTAECWGHIPDRVEFEPHEVFAEADLADPAWRGSHPGGTFSAVSTLYLYACGIRPGGELECWSPHWPPGAGVPDPDVPLGGSASLVREPPRRGVPEELAWVDGELHGGPYVALASGWYHTCGIRPDAAVECHGSTATSPDGEFKTIHVGYKSGCGVRSSGDLACWRLSAVPVEWDPQFALASTERVVAIDSTTGGTCALADTGDIVCTVGLPVRLPDRVEGPYEQISVGGGWVVHYGASHPSEESAHVCAIDNRGRLGCWGDNDSGQTALPPQWLDDPPYRAVAAGFAHTCAIGVSGAVVCWGDDRHGQTRSPPGEYTALSAGQWHTCALRADGEIICWGNGPAEHDQEYDDPPHDHRTQPPPGPFAGLAVGQWHACGLRPDGTATCWLNY